MPKASGHRGSWFADVNGESLPCVHKYWWKRGGCYHEPNWKPGEKQRDELIAAIRKERRVILTDDDVDETQPPSFTRTGYIGVYSVDEVTVDSEGLKFGLSKELLF